LAEKTLEGTDWNVQSEVFVEKISETLVYLSSKEDLKVTHIIDQDLNNPEQGVTTESFTLPKGSEILAFYSSCTNKPHRFQFIYLDDLA
jgi:hypothetical protein